MQHRHEIQHRQGGPSRKTLQMIWAELLQVKRKQCPQPPAGLLTPYKYPRRTLLSWNGSCPRSAAGNDLSTPTHVLSVSSRPVMRRAGRMIKVFPPELWYRMLLMIRPEGGPRMTRGSRQNSHLRGLAQMRTLAFLHARPWRARRANSERKVKEMKAKEKQRSLRYFRGLLARSGTGGGPAVKTRRRCFDVWRGGSGRGGALKVFKKVE